MVLRQVKSNLLITADCLKLLQMKQDNILREQIIDLLTKGNAHVTFEEAVKKLPAKLRGVVTGGLPYSIWQLVEHIRITQWDILEFSRDPKHVSPKWPDEYWPNEAQPHSDEAWSDTINKIKEDKQAFIDLIRLEDNDLYEPFSWGDGQNLLRESFLIADHTSYHTGEIIAVRRLLHAWE